MFAEKQVERILGKLTRLEETLEAMLFDTIAQLDAEMLTTDKRLDSAPEDAAYTPALPGTTWGGEGVYAWFRFSWTVDAQWANRPVYLRAKAGGKEGLLFINGVPSGIFTAAQNTQAHGDHYCDLLTMGAPEGTRLDMALESYAWHYTPGSQPLRTTPRSDFMHRYEGMELCVKNEELCQFYFDLKTFNQLAAVLDKNSFVRARIINALIDVHDAVRYSPDDTTREAFLSGIREAQRLLTPLYQYHNASLAPVAMVVGHSHMDTAWHWPIDETVKKCARTFSNQLMLMEEYPEYRFIQSSAYHGWMMKSHYPALYERMKRAIKRGQYEPNGGVWVECDCNIVGGEWLARQFLWGQRYTQSEFGYLSNCFWLPDTFGYSAALPQIMKGSRVDYFLTTKIAWNDTNRFPYDTFYWRGVDGSRVLAHFNKTHLWPDPETCVDFVSDGHRSGDCLQEKTVSNMRLLAYGHGDGGGGPLFEMIEMARRIADVEGCPKVQTTRVDDFMRRLEGSLVRPSTYQGELYLELHRGTLTNQHQIKRNNRLAETALHNAEYAAVRRALAEGKSTDAEPLREMVNTLLVNQFHDILPGTCIHEVHERSLRETTALIDQARRFALDALATEPSDAFSLVNTLGFRRCEPVYMSAAESDAFAGCEQQRFVDLCGADRAVVGPIEIGPFSAVEARSVTNGRRADKPFHSEKDTLETPFYHVRFDEKGYIASLWDKTAKRELRGAGLALGAFLIAEDVPLAWDNWDIDADIEEKLRDDARLLDRRVISDGVIEWRVRSRYQLTERSTLEQDMVFYADSRMIRFDTLMDWQDDHRLLKVSFDTSIRAGEARQEIQFGHIKRPTTRNTSVEKAMFEVCNHRFTDLSQTRYGAALLNDCKYGVSVRDGQIALTLHKGGCRPDDRGDKGRHLCTYAFLPHEGTFSVSNVVEPAYCLNNPLLVIPGCARDESSLLTLASRQVIAETVKPAEDAGRGYIVRLYEAEGSDCATELRFGHPVRALYETNLLEEDLREIEPIDGAYPIVFHPFEIKTLRVLYDGANSMAR